MAFSSLAGSDIRKQKKKKQEDRKHGRILININRDRVSACVSARKGRGKGEEARGILSSVRNIPIGASTRVVGTHGGRADCLNYGWPVSLSGTARGGSPGRSHATDNSRARAHLLDTLKATGGGGGGTRREKRSVVVSFSGECLSGVGDAGITMGRKGKEGKRERSSQRKRTHVVGDFRERLSALSLSLSTRMSFLAASLHSEKRHLAELAPCLLDATEYRAYRAYHVELPTP